MTDNFKPTGETAPADFMRSTDDGSAHEVGSDTLAVSDVVFGQAPSARLPFWKAAALESQANFAQSTPDGALFARQNNGPIKGGVESQTDEEKLDNLRDGIAIVAAEEKRQRELWAQQMHSYAGLDMTGAEWSELGERLSGDTELRRRLIDRIKQDGKSESDAKKIADEVAMLAKMQGVPHDQWTPDQKALDQRADQNSDYQKYLHLAGEQNKELSGPKSEVRAQISDATSQVSVDLQADSLDSFASAPKLTEHMNMAAIAAPIAARTDTKSPVIATPAPAAGGLDI